jgi:hypothetical protein
MRCMSFASLEPFGVPPGRFLRRTKAMDFYDLPRQLGYSIFW